MKVNNKLNADKTPSLGFKLSNTVPPILPPWDEEPQGSHRTPTDQKICAPHGRIGKKELYYTQCRTPEKDMDEIKVHVHCACAKKLLEFISVQKWKEMTSADKLSLTYIWVFNLKKWKMKSTSLPMSDGWNSSSGTANLSLFIRKI